MKKVEAKMLRFFVIFLLFVTLKSEGDFRIPSSDEEVIKIYNSVAENHNRNILIAVGEIKETLKLSALKSAEFNEDSLEHKFERLVLEYEDGSHIDLSRKLSEKFDRLLRKNRANLKEPEGKVNSTKKENNLIVNILTFQGAWVHKFDPFKTHLSKFHLDEENSTDVEMMVVENELFNYARIDEFNVSLIELPYKYSGISMVILLPDSATGLESLEANLAKLNLTEISQNMSLVRMNVKIPRFQITYDVTIQLGRRGKSNENTTDSSQTQNLLHLAVLKVTEFGAEVFNAVGIKHNPAYQELTDPDIQDFIVDHPFLFLIKSKSKIQFIGRVISP